MPSFSSPIIISGAGIGGLTLAIALQQRGLPVRVLERTPVLAPVGAGLALQPNAMAVMKALGLADAVIAAGQPVARAAMLNQRGEALGREQDMAALSAPFGAPVVAIHRARLHRVLQDAVKPGTIELGIAVVDYEVRGGGAIVRCADGATQHSGLLVAADGLHSQVREKMIGDGEPTYSGYTSWRGVTTSGAGPRLERMSESWGRGERFGMVDIGHGEIYWFAVANAPPGEKDPDGKDPGGQANDVRTALLARFGGWHSPVKAVIEATPADRILRTDIADREPRARWHDGPVVLLGDAAHPMTPNLGQGACQAIEDAAALAEALGGRSPGVAPNAAGSGENGENYEEIVAAVRRYEQQRVARANEVVRAARRFGAIAQWANPTAVWLRDLAMRVTPDRVARQQLERLWRT